MKTSWHNKVAVITGGGGGIGRAVAEKLARNGMKIVLLGGNNLENLKTTAAIVEKYSSVLVLPGNLTDLQFLADSIRTAAETFGGIDLLINNAGVAQSTAFDQVSPDEFDRIMAINTRVPYFLSQYALPFLNHLYKIRSI